MERLTKKIGGVICYVGEHKQNDEDVPAEMTTGAVRDVLTSLFAYEEAEEKDRLARIPENTPDIDFMRLFELIMADAENRVVVLPCKVGDAVYYIDGGKCYKAKAVTFRINESGVRVYCERNFMGYIGFEGIYGKTVFLTREAAEEALQKTT